MIGAVADLGEATSAAAVSALNATNALASSATALVTVATSNGLTAGANMWHGIDLADIQAGRCAGSITALSGPVLEAWLHTTAAQAHFPCLDGNLTERLIAAVQAVEASLPSTQAISEDFSLRGTFTSLRIMATWQDFGQVSIQFEASFLFFTPIWSNPLWTQWGCKLDSERDQILKALRLLLLDLPATPPQRAYAGLDLEVALSAPTASQWALIWHYVFQVCSRFHGGFGRVDASAVLRLFWPKGFYYLFVYVLVMVLMMVGVSWKRWKHCNSSLELSPMLPWDAFEIEAELEVPVGTTIDLTRSPTVCPISPVSTKSPKTEGSNESFMLVR